jgi:hypothetical protein
MRKKFLAGQLFLAAALGLTLIAGITCCSGKGKDEKTGGAAVKGYVFYAGSKKPFSGASVLAGTKSTATDGSGRFEVAGLSPGTLLLTAYAKGYAHVATISIAGGENVLPTIYIEKMPGAPVKEAKAEEKKEGEEEKAGTGEEKTTEEGGKEAEAGKESTTTEKGPSSEDPEDVIKAFYKAVNAQDYKEADRYRIGLSAKKLKKIYQPYIKSVAVTKIKKMPEIQKGKLCYNVIFKATFLKPYPAGGGTLPTFHCLKKDKKGNWRISNISTGP